MFLIFQYYYELILTLIHEMIKIIKFKILKGVLNG